MTKQLWKFRFAFTMWHYGYEWGECWAQSAIHYVSPVDAAKKYLEND